MNRNRRNALVAGSLLLLAGWRALGGVAWNRSGEAESKLVLSQRELQRNWSYGFWAEQWRRTAPGASLAERRAAQ